MDPLIEELNEITAEMTSLVAEWKAAGHDEPLKRLGEAATTVGRAWSGSSLGYHANVYYEGFQPPPPSCHFSSEWGLMKMGDTSGRWFEYTPEYVNAWIERIAKSPDLKLVTSMADTIHAAFEQRRRAMVSILEVALSRDTDAHIGDAQSKLKAMRVQTTADFLFPIQGRVLRTRDSVALGQGPKHAPHLVVIANVAALSSPVKSAQELAELAQDVAQHLRRRGAIHASRAPAAAPDAPVDTSACDVLLVTVTKVETKAMMDALVAEVGRPETTWGDVKSYLRFPPVNKTRVVLVRSEMGSDSPGGASTTIRDALREVNPKAIIMVGIAFGMDELKQPIGHVLVSHQLLTYELSRVGTDKESGAPTITPRGDRVTASPMLLDRLRAAELDFNGSVEFGLLLSGQKLIDNLDLRAQLLSQHPEAKGGEMEGAGLYSAAGKTDWIVVKAVCDYADGNKAVDKAEKQKTAAEAAASFVLHTLQMGGLAPQGQR